MTESAQNKTRDNAQDTLDSISAPYVSETAEQGVAATPDVRGVEKIAPKTAGGNEWLGVTLVLCSCIVGTIFMRIISYFMPSYTTYGEYLLSDAAFALPVQLLFFLVLPFCIYKFVGRRTVRETLEYGSYTKFSPWYLLALPLGVAVYFVTIGVSSGWTGLLRLTGYTVPSGSPDLPSEFNGGFFAAEVFMTAVLPAVCEEFAMRGGLLTTAKRGFGKLVCVIFCAVAFGLFHQNIRQVFYTSVFGALAAYVVCETGSIYPAVFMHFANNFCSVYFSYASAYGWVGGGLFKLLGSVPGWVLLALFAAAGLLAAAIVVLILYFNERKRMADRLAALRGGVRSEAFTRGGIAAVEKPSLFELSGVIAIGVVALLTTIFTYVWGFLY